MTQVAFYNPISSFDGTMSEEPRSFDEYGNVESFFPMSFLCNESIFNGSEVAVTDFEKVLINNNILMKTVLLNIKHICDTQDLYNYIYESKENHTRRQR